MSHSRRPFTITAVLAAALLLLTGCTTEPTVTHNSAGVGQASRVEAELPEAPLPPALFNLAGLPSADWDAVIPALMPAPASATASESYTLTADSPLYASPTDNLAPVARLTQTSLLGTPTVVPVVAVDGEWSQVLVSARRTLPSQDAGAVAQSAAWVRTSTLVPYAALTSSVRIDLSDRTLTIINSATGQPTYSALIVVGADTTASPVTLTYVQARWADSEQSVYGQVHLTGAHSTAADSPYDGNEGGTIGLHSPLYAQPGSAESHGCIRVDEATMDVLISLPIGTLIEIVA